MKTPKIVKQIIGYNDALTEQYWRHTNAETGEVLYTHSTKDWDGVSVPSEQYTDYRPPIDKPVPPIPAMEPGDMT